MIKKLLEVQMNKKNLIIILGVILMLSYCKKSPAESEKKSFFNTLWTLESFDISGEILRPPEDQKFNIKFIEDGTFSAHSDCNEINGNFTVDSDNSLITYKVGTTKAYCGAASYDKKYYEALQDIKSYKIDNNVLHIYYGNNSRLNYKAE
jgi:heat shock protein HslJ